MITSRPRLMRPVALFARARIETTQNTSSSATGGVALFARARIETNEDQQCGFASRGRSLREGADRNTNTPTCRTLLLSRSLREGADRNRDYLAPKTYATRRSLREGADRNKRRSTMRICEPRSLSSRGRGSKHHGQRLRIEVEDRRSLREGADRNHYVLWPQLDDWLVALFARARIETFRVGSEYVGS